MWVVGFKLKEMLEIFNIKWILGRFFWISWIDLIVVLVFFWFFLILVEIGRVKVL